MLVRKGNEHPEERGNPQKEIERIMSKPDEGLREEIASRDEFVIKMWSLIELSALVTHANEFGHITIQEAALYYKYIIDQLHSKAQARCEEWAREERENLVGAIKNYVKAHPTATVADIIFLLKFREETIEALRKGEG